MTEDFLRRPESVYNASIHAGLFSSDDFIYDKKAFIDRCCGAWNVQINNYFSCPTQEHEDAAEALHELYIMSREFVVIIPRAKASRFSKMFAALAKGDLDAAFGEFGKAKWPLVSEMAKEKFRTESLASDVIKRA